MSVSQNSIYSQGFNFGSFLEKGVDPRTGQYTCSVDLYQAPSESRNCPPFKLSLSYSPLSTENAGLGKGWSLNFSSYRDKTLHLYTGESFKVIETSQEFTVADQKLKSFHVTKVDNDYQVVHKSGLVEILSHSEDLYDRSVPTALYAPTGRSLQFEWKPKGVQPRLQKIWDGSECLLEITYDDAEVKVTRAPYAAETSTFTLLLRDDQLTEIHTPLDNTRPWTFAYAFMNGFTCLNEITSPTGLYERMNYKENGHRPPTKAPYPPIPYVISHLVDPGKQQAQTETQYSYSDFNFLGYGSSHDWSSDGDNLYRSASNYQYTSTVKTVGGSITEYVYNKYHLPVSIKEEMGTKTKTQTFTYYADVYDGFEKQKEQYQLPHTVTTTYCDHATEKSREETTSYVFDEWGNPTQEVQSNGITIDRTYYSPEGERDPITKEVLCPEDPHGFQRHLRIETVTPAASIYSTPTRSQYYTYLEVETAINAKSSRFIAVKKLVSLEESNILNTTEYQYFSQPSTRDHCRIKRQTTWMSDDHPSTQDWSYEYPVSEQIEQTITTTSWDRVSIQEKTDYSLSTGFVLARKDQADVRDLFEYDKLGRMIKATTAVGSLQESTRCHDYALKEDSEAYLTVTDSKGVRTLYYIDGLERVIRVEKQDGDVSWSPERTYTGTFRPVQENTYNTLGQCIETVEIDWLRRKNTSPEEQRSVETMEYDDWGEVWRTIDSSGMVTITLDDPISLTRTEGFEGEGQKKTYLNHFGSPVKTELLDKNGLVHSQVEYFYDGLGRLIEEADVYGRVTKYTPDAFDRITETMWSSGRVIAAKFSAKSAALLPISITTNGLTVGEQSFDGLNRVTKRIVGTRTTDQVYEGNSPEPAQMIAQKGERTSFTYDPKLGYALTSRAGCESEDKYQYDERTGAPVLLEGTHSTHNLEYLPSGLLDKETIRIHGEDLCAQFTWSMAGKLQGYIDVHKQAFEAQYDNAGRVKQLLQGTLKASFTYGKANRVTKMQVQDDQRGTGLTTDLTHDEFGRETHRTILKAGKKLYELVQCYNDGSLLSERHQRDGDDNVLRSETFEYDDLNRLTKYTCEGSEAPIDEKDRRIKGQNFKFDEFDNVCEVCTTFQDGSQNIANYARSETDPTQLAEITNTHTSAAPHAKLAYDDNGCLIQDEEGRKLDYDSMSRLIAVRDSDDSNKILSQYEYDAVGRLLCQRIPDQPDTWFFYREDKLVAVQSGERQISYLADDYGYWGQLVKEGGNISTQVFALDGQQSVLAWIDTDQHDKVNLQQYTPYGFGTTGSSIGFNGQWRDPITGWYHLGNGYRVYNPVLMRFHQPDPWSPFTSGEINPYAYCLGDPINRIDPSGHFSLFGIKFGWKDLITAIAGIAASVVLGVLTGGASLAVQIGLSVAVGVVTEVATGMIGDALDGNQITWKSVGMDALGGALGGLTGKAGKQGLKQGFKVAKTGVKTALGRAGKATITKASKESAEKLTRKAAKKIFVKAVKKEAKSFAKSKAKEGAKSLFKSGDSDDEPEQLPSTARDSIRPALKDGEYAFGDLTVQQSTMSSLSSYRAGQPLADMLNRDNRYGFWSTGQSQDGQEGGDALGSFEQARNVYSSLRRTIRAPHRPFGLQGLPEL
ncbi:RHS repeat protein [Aspergillus flavus]|nr:RHS repeat protein [Aspergillus flavus]